MSMSSHHRYAATLLLPLSLLLAACGSNHSVVENPDASSTPVNESSAVEPDGSYCRALERMFTAQNFLIEGGFDVDDDVWDTSIEELITEIDSTLEVALPSHKTIVAGYKDIIGQVAAMSRTEFEGHPTLNDEVADYIMDEMFVIGSHAEEVCEIDTSVDIELDPTEPVSTQTDATCTAIDEEHFSVAWQNSTGQQVDVTGSVTFSDDDGTRATMEFSLTFVSDGERVDHRFFSFDGTASSCEVTKLESFPTSENIFATPGVPGDTCAIGTDSDGRRAATLTSRTAANGSLTVELALLDTNDVRLDTLQVLREGLGANEEVEIIEQLSESIPETVAGCSVAGRYNF